MAVFIELDGQQYFLGLNAPEQRPVSTRPFSVAFPIPSPSELIKLAEDPQRPNLRERWAGRDWIGNQNPLSSCNGYANKHRAERCRALRGLKHVKLSGEGIYALMNGGRDQGSILSDGERLSVEVGFAPESLVPVRRFFTERTLPQAARAEMHRFRIDETYHVDTEQELIWALLNGFQAVVAVHANNSYMRLDREGVRGASNGVGNHAVAVQDVRYNRRTSEWEFDEVGSWDITNGDGGYAWLTWRKHLQRPNQMHRFNVARTTHDDPEDVNPPAVN
jgi:hypothetical protein